MQDSSYVIALNQFLLPFNFLRLNTSVLYTTCVCYFRLM